MKHNGLIAIPYNSKPTYVGISKFINYLFYKNLEIKETFGTGSAVIVRRQPEHRYANIRKSFDSNLQTFYQL